MKIKVRNFARMVEATNKFLDKQAQNYASHPILQTYVVNLHTYYDQLLGYEQAHQISTIGLTKTKAQRREIAIQMAVIIAQNLELYAIDNNDNDLAANSRQRKSKLTKLSETECLSTLQFILQQATLYQVQAQDYGNTSALISDLQTAIDNYHNVLSAPRNRQVEKKFASTQIDNVIEKLRIQLQKIDLYIDNFKLSHPEFWGEYQTIRNIIDLAHRHTLSEVIVFSNDAQVVDAIVTIQNAGHTYTRTTDTNGKAQFVGAAVGYYTCTISKEGYADLIIQNFLVSSKDSNTQNISLNAA